MPDKDDKFRRVVADPKETGVTSSHEDETSSQDQVVNAETGLPVDEGSVIETSLKADPDSNDESIASDVSLVVDDEVDVTNISMSASEKKETKEQDVDLSAKKESKASDIAFKGSKKKKRNAADSQLTGGNETQSSEIAFSADKQSVEGDAKLVAKGSAEYHTELCQKAESLNSELELLAASARENAQKAQETMNEVERIAKAKNIPSRLAARLANVKATTSKIKESTVDLATKRDALKGGK